MLLLLVSFLSGATNENSGPAMILVLGLYWLIRVVKNKKIYVIHLVSLMLSTFSFFLMMSSPGSLNRGRVDYSIDFFLEQFHLKFLYAIQKYGVIYLLIFLLGYYLYRRSVLNK